MCLPNAYIPFIGLLVPVAILNYGLTATSIGPLRQLLHFVFPVLMAHTNNKKKNIKLKTQCYKYHYQYPDILYHC